MSTRTASKREGQSLLGLRRLLPYVVLLLVVVLLPGTGLLSDYWLFFGANSLVMAIAVLGMNVSVGYMRLLNLCQAGMMGVGAYGAAYLLERTGNYVLGVVGAALLAGALSLAVGLLAVRVRTNYFMIVTIGVQQALITCFTLWVSVTGGGVGKRVGDISVGGVDVTLLPNAFMLAGVAFVVALYAVQCLKDSRSGRAMIALGQSDLAAQSVGIREARHNIMAMSISGAYAGLAGALMLPAIGFLAPNMFDFSLSILLMAMLIIGGLGSNLGVVAGVFVVSLLDAKTRTFTSGIATMIYGLAIMAVVLFAPGGLAMLGRRLRALVSPGLWRRTPAVPQRPAQALPIDATAMPEGADR